MTNPLRLKNLFSIQKQIVNGRWKPSEVSKPISEAFVYPRKEREALHLSGFGGSARTMWKTISIVLLLLATFFRKVASYQLTSRGFPELWPFQERSTPLTVLQRTPSLDPSGFPPF